jgi:hypothetical protein
MKRPGDYAVLAERPQRPRRRRHDAAEPQYYFGPRRWNPKCIVSFCLFLFSVLAAAVAVILSRVLGTENLGGALFLLNLPIFGASMILAVLGLRQCNRLPEFDANSRLMAILTLAFGSVFGLFLLVGLAVGLQRNPPAENSRSAEWLSFPAARCAFRLPGPPWRQMDARAFGIGPMLTIERPGPLYFKLSAHPIDLIHRDPRAWLVDWSKREKQRSAASCRLLTEGQFLVRGMSGWRVETEGHFQGQDYFIVDWLLATNGLGYQLTLWGPTNLTPQVRKESERLFTEFQLDVPGPALPGLPGQ